MKEYRIIEGGIEHCQKALNQWKRSYELEVISMCVRSDTSYSCGIVILLTIEKKEVVRQRA